MVLSSINNTYSSPTPADEQWLSPMEAYGISGDINDPDVYLELKNAFELSPPASIELTLIAIAKKDFQELQVIENQKIVSKNGYTDMFYVLGNFEEFSSDTALSLHFEDGEEKDGEDEKYFGWYAQSFGVYYPKDGDTPNNSEEEQQEYERCNIFISHLGEENIFKDYIDPDAFYIEIRLPFGYHITSGKETPNSEVKVLARVDKVMLEMNMESEKKSPELVTPSVDEKKDVIVTDPVIDNELKLEQSNIIKNIVIIVTIIAAIIGGFYLIKLKRKQ